MKIYHDHQETTKGELAREIMYQERQVRDVRIIEERTGVTASDEKDITFLKKGE